MTIMRFISHSFLQKSSPSACLRWLSTVADVPAAERKVARQHKKRATLVNRVVSKVNFDSDPSRLPSVLNNWVGQGNEVKRPDIIDLTNCFRNRKNFKAALQVYNWMESCNLEITEGDKAVRIDLLCKTEGVDSAENYFNTLEASEKTAKTYGALLCSYCKQKLVDKAIDTFDLMKSLNFMTTLNYNNVLYLYYSVGKYENLFSLAQEMEDRNIPLDVYTYNMLINSHGALKNVDAIDGILEKMQSKNVADNLFTLGNLATIYFDLGLLDKAKSYLEKMEKTKSWPVKDLFEGCRTRIKLYSQMNDVQGTLRAWAALKLAFPKPNNTSYLIVLLGLAKLEDQEALEKIFKEWEENKSSFDPRVPNVVLEYYLSRDMLEKANSLYTRFVDRSKNLSTLDLFASLNVRNEDLDTGLKHIEMGLELAKDRESKWFPTVDTVKLFLKHLKENDDPERARVFADRMKGLKRVDLDGLGF